MNETEYSLIRLWPEFGRVWQGDFTSPEGLSALFVIVLFTITTFFAFLSLKSFWQAKRHLKFYKSLLEGLTSEHLLEKRRDITRQALANGAYGRLWREFDESLVNVPQKQRLCNTLDAAHFFNTHTLARGLTENRMVAAVPGFLTAIGVLGTFAGLQMGLSSLSESMTGTPEIDQLTVGIFGMIGGASIAFMTSVWGVFTSVAFNFFEKWLERNIRSSISTFQNEVDYLFPRITAEQSLSNIEDFTRQSNERLAELDEKIGHKLQEAMREASGAIREGMENSLNSILGPAIESLVNNANSGSEKALESLLERFLQGVGSAGEDQRQMMQQAATDITKASDGMSAGLSGFAAKMESQIESMAERNTEILAGVNSAIRQQLQDQQMQEEKRQDGLTLNMSKFVTDLGSQMQQLADQNATTMKTVQSELHQQVEAQQGREIARQKVLYEQLQGFQGNQEKITKNIEGVIDAQKEQSAELTSGLSGVIEHFEKLSVSHENATVAMQTVSSDLKATSNQLGILSTNLRSASDSFAGELSKAVEKANDITERNVGLVGLVEKLIAELDTTRERITETAEIMGVAAEKAGAGLSAVEGHFDTLSKSLSDSVESLGNQVAELLKDYSERVQSQTVARLNTWNEQTNNYIGSMTDAVRALNNVVDEIDGKIRSPQNGADS